MADLTRIPTSAAAVKAGQAKHISPFAVDHQSPLSQPVTAPHRTQALGHMFGRDPILAGPEPASLRGISVRPNTGKVDPILGQGSPEAKKAGINTQTAARVTQDNGNIVSGPALPSSPSPKSVGIRVGNANRPDTAGPVVEMGAGAAEVVRRQLHGSTGPKSLDHTERGIKMTVSSHKTNVVMSHDNPPSPPPPSPGKVPKVNVQSQQPVDKRCARPVHPESANAADDKVAAAIIGTPLASPKTNPARFKTYPTDSTDVLYHSYQAAEPVIPRNDAEAAKFAAAKDKTLSQKDSYQSIKLKGKQGSGIF